MGAAFLVAGLQGPPLPLLQPISHITTTNLSHYYNQSLLAFELHHYCPCPSIPTINIRHHACMHVYTGSSPPPPPLRVGAGFATPP